jgi:phosphopantothenoylcysteine decarboxylase/phosphopantothenate--cysteine ligase
MNAPQKNIVLGVGAGIAAYKSCELLRRLQDHGYSVTVVPTPSSLNFVGTATWEALSGKPVTTSVFESVDEVRHVQLAKETDAILIAPATADLIARITHGRADDLLTNTVLAATVPVVLVPAMHSSMWTNPATQSNIAILRSRGILVIEPDTGALTSGDSGVGRFPEVPRIISEFEEHLGKLQDFKVKKFSSQQVAQENRLTQFALLEIAHRANKALRWLAKQREEALLQLSWLPTFQIFPCPELR